MRPDIQLVVDNELGRFPLEWREPFARGRIWLRKDEGMSQLAAGNREEGDRNFIEAARIRP